MKEIWYASENPTDWKIQPGNSILSLWWFLWIATGMAGQASFRLSLRAETLDELSTSGIANLLSNAIEIPLVIVAITMIGKIYKMQMGHHRANI